jgi:glycosyltransferase involved in cell wall biosynthesis
MKKIGIIGTRGIPNQYGGFEQFAEQFSTRMAARGYQVSVYTSHRHPYKKDSYRNVQLLRCYDPEHLLGTAGQFIYDMNCIRDSRKRQFDIILQLGYTSSTIWSWLYPASSVLVTNMDGLEWTRSKYNKPTRYFLTHAEKWGVRYSDHLIADSLGIQAYLKEKYNAGSDFISYGASIYEPAENDAEQLKTFNVKPYEYDLAIARFEPENNIEAILQAYRSLTGRKLLLVGNHKRTVFGRRMYEQYCSASNISFLGSIFDTDILNVLRYYSRLYLHGHSVGGTNPSLLEAMGCNALICAHDNIFNRNVLGDDAFYFKNDKDIKAIAEKDIDKTYYTVWLQNNRQKIEDTYNWERVTEQIENKLQEWEKC